MKIRNLTPKPIGFGSVVILPDQTGETPKGYDRDHPTVKYYLSRKWIAEVGAGRSGAAGSTPTGLNVNVNAGGPGGAADDTNDDLNDENGAGGSAANENNGAGAGGSENDGEPGGAAPEKPLDRMNKDELQALAFAQGVVFADTDTRQVLIDKIKAAKNANA